MAKGQPDFGSLAPTETIVGLSDLGELAVRLGSPVAFHRTGNVIFIDDFECGLARLAYWRLGSPVGSVNISNLYVLHGDLACELVAKANSYVELDYELAIVAVSQMGFEFSWNRVDEGNLEYIKLEVGFNDGTNWWYAEIWWTAATGAWQYVNSLGASVALSPTVDYDSDRVCFNHVKLIVDFVNKKYVKLIANNLTYDLSDQGLSTGGAAVPAYVYMLIQTVANAGGDATNYIDDVIITQNEP